MSARARPLTQRQRRFVEEYLIDHNAVRAYLRAFGPGVSYRSAATLAGRLLKKVEVRAELRAARLDHARRCRAEADRVTRELALIAFADIRDLFGNGWRPRPLADIQPAARRAIASFKVRRISRRRVGTGKNAVEEVVEAVDVRLADKLDALGKLARRLGLDRELPPLDRVLGMLPPELAAEVRGRLAALTGGESG